MREFVFILYLNLWGAASIIAQDTWTYDACIRYAWDHNLSQKNLQYNAQKQRVSYHAALYNFLPEADAMSTYQIRNGRTIDPNTNDVVENQFFFNNYSLGADLLLFQGFRKQNQLRYERIRLDVSRHRVEAHKNDIAFQVLQAYVTHLIYQGLADIQEEVLRLSEKDVAHIETRIGLGLSARGDLYAAQSRVAADEYLLVQFQNQAGSSANELKRTMNLPVETELRLQAMEMDAHGLDEPETADLMQKAKGTLPQIAAAYAEYDASVRQIKIARSWMAPSLSAYNNWSSGYYETSKDKNGAVISYREQLNNNLNHSYGLSLRIPILAGLSRRSALQQAKISSEQAENALKLELSNLEYEIEQARIDLTQSEAANQSAQKRVTSSELAFEVAEKQWQKGIISLLDYYQIKNEYALARAQLLRTGLELFIQQKTIKFYVTGTLLDQNG